MNTKSFAPLAASADTENGDSHEAAHTQLSSLARPGIRVNIAIWHRVLSRVRAGNCTLLAQGSENAAARHRSLSRHTAVGADKREVG